MLLIQGPAWPITQLCLKTETLAITQPMAINVAFSTTAVSCFGGIDGVITSTITGGTGPYTYFWSPGSFTTSSVASLPAGNYTLIVTDNSGCSKQFSVSLQQAAPLAITIATIAETCNYLNDGSATATITGGNSPYALNWLPGNVTSAAVSSLQSGTYTLNAVDAKGCVQSSTVMITEPSVISLTAVSVSQVSCFGGTNGIASVLASGGTPNYTYSWSPSAGNNSLR